MLIKNEYKPLKINIMRKRKEKISKNILRDEIGMVGNISWQLKKSCQKVAKKSSQKGWININNPNSEQRIELNAKPP